MKKIIAQSIAFVYAPDAPQPVTEDAPLLDFAEPAYGETARAVHSLEQQITANPAFIGIVLRYGWLYGAGTGTGFNAPVDFAPPVHAEAAAHAAVLALQCEQSGIYTRQTMMHVYLARRRNASWGLMRGFGCKR